MKEYTHSDASLEQIYDRIRDALFLLEKGHPIQKAARAAHMSAETLHRFARKSLANEAPSWIYERFSAAAGKHCDTCNELLLPGEWHSRQDKYLGHTVVMFFCSRECQDEWDNGEAEAEVGMSITQATKEAAA